MRQPRRFAFRGLAFRASQAGLLCPVHVDGLKGALAEAHRDVELPRRRGAGQERSIDNFHPIGFPSDIPQKPREQSAAIMHEG
jgi:hypothetical protein